MEKYLNPHSPRLSSRLQQEPGKQPAEPNKVPFLQVILSVLAASFGVQNYKNRERDFTKGKFWPFVAAALLFTLLFVLTIVTVVKIVLSK
jgi:hypothetical protein